MPDTLIAALIIGLSIGLPLLLLARAMARTLRMNEEVRQLRRYEAFTAVLARVEAKNVGPAQKIAAVRQLREFPEYRHITVAMCNSIEVNGRGPGVEIFQNELKQTEAHLLKAG